MADIKWKASIHATNDALGDGIIFRTELAAALRAYAAELDSGRCGFRRCEVFVTPGGTKLNVMAEGSCEEPVLLSGATPAKPDATLERTSPSGDKITVYVEGERVSLVMAARDGSPTFICDNRAEQAPPEPGVSPAALATTLPNGEKVRVFVEGDWVSMFAKSADGRSCWATDNRHQLIAAEPAPEACASPQPNPLLDEQAER